jgi:hypothetical protein
MALVTVSSVAKVDASSAQFAPQISGDVLAGEDLFAGAACYIKSTDGRAYLSNGTAANEAAKFDGMTPRAVKAGQSITLYGPGTKFEYTSGATIGTDLYVGTTAGRLDTAATTGGTSAIGRMITPRILQIRSYR